MTWREYSRSHKSTGHSTIKRLEKSYTIKPCCAWNDMAQYCSVLAIPVRIIASGGEIILSVSTSRSFNRVQCFNVLCRWNTRVSLMFNDSKLVHAQKNKESILESPVFETFNVLRLTNRLKVSGSASNGHCDKFKHSNWVKIPKKIGIVLIRVYRRRLILLQRF